MSIVKKELLKDLEDLMRFQFALETNQQWDEYDKLEEKIENLEREIIDTPETLN